MAGDHDPPLRRRQVSPVRFFVAAIRFGTINLVANSNLLTRVHETRLIFPLAAVLAQLFDFAVAPGILAIAALAMGAGVFRAAALPADPFSGTPDARAPFRGEPFLSRRQISC